MMGCTPLRALTLAALLVLGACQDESDISSRVGKPCASHADCACEPCANDHVCLLAGADQGLCVVNDPDFCDVLEDEGVLVSLDASGPEVLAAVEQQAMAAGYVCALGDLIVPEEATELPGAEHLTSVAGSVFVRDSNLTSLSALQALEDVRGDVVIRDNALLEYMRLGVDLSIGGDLEIAHNPTLGPLRAEQYVSLLCQCGEIGGSIRLCSNGALDVNCRSVAAKTCADFPPSAQECP